MNVIKYLLKLGLNFIINVRTIGINQYTMKKFKEIESPNGMKNEHHNTLQSNYPQVKAIVMNRALNINRSSTDIIPLYYITLNLLRF